MNNSISACFTIEKITWAIFQMNPLGALGPDGFLTHFFQTHSSSINKDICDFVLNFLNNHGFLDEVNSTYITLIPKVKHISKVGDF